MSSTYRLLIPLLLLEPGARASAEEVVSAEEFAARCAAAEGRLVIEDDLRIEGGTAELGDCRVSLGSFRLGIEGARLIASGFLMVDGQPQGEIRAHASAFGYSDPGAHILLRAHHNRIEASTLDFAGTISLETGAADRGEMHIENSALGSRSANIHIGASGRGMEGHSVVKRCQLSAETQVEILASAMEPHGAGRVQVAENDIVSRGTVLIQAGEDGRVRVEHNHLVAAETAALLSGGRTRVRHNDFRGSGEVIIDGPRCEARDNLPEVACR